MAFKEGLSDGKLDGHQARLIIRFNKDKLKDIKTAVSLIQCTIIHLFSALYHAQDPFSNLDVTTSETNTICVFLEFETVLRNLI